MLDDEFRVVLQNGPAAAAPAPARRRESRQQSAPVTRSHNVRADTVLMPSYREINDDNDDDGADEEDVSNARSTKREQDECRAHQRATLQTKKRGRQPK